MHSPPTPRRPPPALILATALAGMLILATALAWLAWQFAMLPPAVAAILRIAVFVLPLGGAVETGWIAWRRWADHRYIAAAHHAAIERARTQVAPLATSYHHAPQITHASAPPPTIIDAEPVAALPPGVPTFGELLDSGRVGQGRPLILGFRADDGQAIEGSWTSLYSCGIGGMTGSGKSWLAAFLLAQSALQGGRLIVCDLHAGNDESLATRIAALAPAYMCDVANTPEAILSALKLAGDTLKRRMAGQGGTWPIIVAVDEWTSLLRTKVGDVLPQYAEDFAEQGRKYNVNALLSAQGWTIDTAGRVRNRLTSHFVLRQRPDEARYQLGLPASSVPLDVRLLPDATGYLLNVRGELIKFVVPRMTTADLDRVGTMIPREAVTHPPIGFRPASAPLPAIAAEATGKPPGSGGAEAASTATGSRGSASSEAIRAAGLFRQNLSEKAIIKELRGIEGGRGYDQARDEVRRLIVDGLTAGED